MSKMIWWRKILCWYLDWHEPDPDLSEHLTHFGFLDVVIADGCVTYCKHCRFRLLMDSQGNYFACDLKEDYPRRRQFARMTDEDFAAHLRAREAIRRL